MASDTLLRLPAGTVRPVPAEGITCLAGLCWATQSADARDHVLKPGVSWRPAPRRAALVWALTDTTLRVAAREARAHPLGPLARALLQALSPARASGQGRAPQRSEATRSATSPR